MRSCIRIVALLVVTSCGRTESQTPSPPTPSKTVPPIVDAAIAPSGPPTLRLVGCGPAPVAPYMLAGDPDVPGTKTGYHAGAPANTAYVRQPFGLPQQPLAKPNVWASMSSSGDEKLGKALTDAVKAKQPALVACVSKALADPSDGQHELVVVFRPKLEVTQRTDIPEPLVDAAAMACVTKVLSEITLAPSIRAAVADHFVSLSFAPLEDVDRPTAVVKTKKDDFEIRGSSTFGPRPSRQAWTGFRPSGREDGASLASVAVATITPKLPAIEACLAKLQPAPLTGSIRGLVQVGTSLYVEPAGLGDNPSAACIGNVLANIDLVGMTTLLPISETRYLACDFTWGAAAPLRATVENYAVVRVHAADIEFYDEHYTAADDLPHEYFRDTTLVIADADAPGSLINAALAFTTRINGDTMLAVTIDSGPPAFVGRAAMPSFGFRPGAHTGFDLAAGGKVDSCACPAGTKCEGAWLGIGDRDLAKDLLAGVAAAARAGFPGVAVGAHYCGR